VARRDAGVANSLAQSKTCESVATFQAISSAVPSRKGRTGIQGVCSIPRPGPRSTNEKVLGEHPAPMRWVSIAEGARLRLASKSFHGM
jgi:hypothetical protein